MLDIKIIYMQRMENGADVAIITNGDSVFFKCLKHVQSINRLTFVFLDDKGLCLLTKVYAKIRKRRLIRYLRLIRLHYYYIIRKRPEDKMIRREMLWHGIGDISSTC